MKARTFSSTVPQKAERNSALLDLWRKDLLGSDGSWPSADKAQEYERAFRYPPATCNCGPPVDTQQNTRHWWQGTARPPSSEHARLSRQIGKEEGARE
jgi:hypothetical protein